MTHGYAQPGTGKRAGVPGVLGLRSLLAQGLEQVFLGGQTLRCPTFSQAESRGDHFTWARTGFEDLDGGVLG